MKTIALLNLALILCLFTLGYLSSMLLSNMHINISEKPFSIDIVGEAGEPSDKISKNQIHILDNKLVVALNEIDEKDLRITSYTDTGSMKPTLGRNANGISYRVRDEKDIGVGDVITYKDRKGNLIVHRVVYIGRDEKGAYFLTKGDNNVVVDEQKVRLSDDIWKLIALIY